MNPQENDYLHDHPFQDEAITFLARHFKSTKAEVLTTLDLYALSAEELVSVITNESKRLSGSD